MLECLLDSVKRIYREGMGKGGKASAVIGGDVFLDILVYVVIQARLRRPHQRLQFAWALCDPEQLQSEGGYYLTVFESAITFLTNNVVE